MILEAIVDVHYWIKLELLALYNSLLTINYLLLVFIERELTVDFGHICLAIIRIFLGLIIMRKVQP